MVAPCVQRTSSAKICSSGLVSMTASSESTRFLFVCLASVFCASLRTMIRPLKTARRLAVQDALVQLVAGAVRLGVVDGRVIIDVLRAVHDVEAVERRLRAFGEHRAGIVADQRAAQRDRVRREVRAAARAVACRVGDVERRRRFDRAPCSDRPPRCRRHDLGDRVGEVASPRPT